MTSARGRQTHCLLPRQDDVATVSNQHVTMRNSVTTGGKEIAENGQQINYKGLTFGYFQGDFLLNNSTWGG